MSGKRHNLFRGRSREVFVVAWDGLRPRGAVFRLESGELTLTGRAVSTATDPAAAVADLSRQLRPHQGRLPAQAVMLTSHVQTAVLKLPINPAKSLPPAEMGRLFRWEMAPCMARHRAQRIGAIMVGRGYLSRRDLQGLLDRLQDAEQSAGGGKRPHRRLGEMAVESGLVTEDQLEECLALQHPGEEQDGGGIACGWLSLDSQPCDNGRNWRWLGSGMQESYRREAVLSLRRCGFKLRAIYPLAGCAAGAPAERSGSGETLLEYANGYINATSFAEGRIDDCRTTYSHDVGNPISSCIEMIDGRSERIRLIGRWPDERQAVHELEMNVGRPCSYILPAIKAEGLGAEDIADMAGMAGAAQDFLVADAGVQLAKVFAADPAVPLHKRGAMRMVAASVAVTAALVGLGADLQNRAAASDEMIGRQQELMGLRSRVSSLQTSAGKIEREIEFFTDVLPARQRLIGDLLAALERSCLDEITLQSLAETPQDEIILRGWGLSPQHIQAFRLALQENLPRTKVADGARPIQKRTMHGLPPGYTFELRLQSPPRTAVTGGRR